MKYPIILFIIIVSYITIVLLITITRNCLAQSDISVLQHDVKTNEKSDIFLKEVKEQQGSMSNVVYRSDNKRNYSTNPVSGLPRLKYTNRFGGNFNIAVGMNAGSNNTTNSFTILIGNNAQASNDFELVIKFLDGTELRQKLPTNTTYDLRGFSGWEDIK